ncbi:A disintegrin and metalloproteinase with thrombospondin motifs 18-like [Glandiceps talaboti]
MRFLGIMEVFRQTQTQDAQIKPMKPTLALRDTTVWFLCFLLLQGFLPGLGHTLSAPKRMVGQSPDYEVAMPVQVNHRGEFLSHDLMPHRRKRSSSGNQDSVENSAYYHLAAYGQKFHLALQPNEKLLAPGFTIQRRAKGKVVSEKLDDEMLSCFYRGKLLSHRNGSVAISACNGLTGLLRTDEEEYLIEPLPSHLHDFHGIDHTQKQQAHMVYKRSVLPKIPKRPSHIIVEKEQPVEVSDEYIHGNPQKQHFCGRRKKFQPHVLEDGGPIAGDEYPDNHSNSTTRQRRSLSTDNSVESKAVETLVVVDQKMLESHGSRNVTTYVLTILNMVSQLFQDGSIGDNINVVLVSLILLEEDEPGLIINHHADHTLNSFCQWQSTLQTLNGSHDHAVLLTGLDICSWKNEPCDTLGFAPINGMCSKYRSCTVNEDSGLGLAFTIAHESGHNFGMVHDGEGNDCSKSRGHIMSPTLTGDNNGIFSWSACSRQYLKDFLTSTKSLCLENEPNSVAEYRFPEKLPGELYDADLQCKWQFGSRASLCTFDFGKAVCKALWCHKDGRRCETKFLPAAEGTSCGVNKWCRQGMCVDYGNDGPKPVNGGWSDFTDFKECSRTCGGGVMYKERKCSNPRPQYGGQFCEGESRVYSMCNIQDCPSSEIDFRSQQCAAYNSKPFRGFYYKWKPYTHVDREESCKLYCIAQDFNFFFALSSKVDDGTPCRDDSLDVCVNGKCQPVGCDYVLGSSARFDSCGVCNGDNSTCDFITGTFTKQPTHNDYYSVIKVPTGARNILVEEMNISSSYLAMRNEHFKYYLTGNWTVDWPGEFKVAGTTFIYSREYNRPESLRALGPTREEITIELLLQGVNPGIRYLYTLPKPENETEPEPPVYTYTWTAIMTDCSATCAGGEMTTVAQCWRDSEKQVDDSFCDPDSKPKSGSYPCNEEPCPSEWEVSEWRDCNRECGGGKQKRKVRCMQQKTQTFKKSVKPSFCVDPKPPKAQACNTQECPPKWNVGKWTECSASCGRGVKTRNITCTSVSARGSKRKVPESFCKYESKPRGQQNCMTEECVVKTQWFVSAWSECSSTCGLGYRSRLLKCSYLDDHGQYRELPDRKCTDTQKPALSVRKPCNLGTCMNGQTDTKWFSSAWSECSKTCGGGIQVRQVTCMSTNQASIATRCNSAEKPTTSQLCSPDTCPGQDPDCVDEFDWCHLVPQHNVCDHKFYGQKCCQSCSSETR